MQEHGQTKEVRIKLELLKEVRVLTRSLSFEGQNYDVIAGKLLAYAEAGEVDSVVRTAAGALDDSIARPHASGVLKVVLSSHPEELFPVWGIVHSRYPEVVAEGAEIIKTVALNNSQDHKLMEEIAATCARGLGRARGYEADGMPEDIKRRCEVDMGILKTLGSINAYFVIGQMLSSLHHKNKWVSQKMVGVIVEIARLNPEQLNAVVDGVVTSFMQGGMSDSGFRIIETLNQFDHELTNGAILAWSKLGMNEERIAGMILKRLESESEEEKKARDDWVGLRAKRYVELLQRHIRINGARPRTIGFGLNVDYEGDTLNVSCRNLDKLLFEIQINFESTSTDSLKEVCDDVDGAIVREYTQLGFSLHYPDVSVRRDLYSAARLQPEVRPQF